jgi:hypothetical protein
VPIEAVTRELDAILERTLAEAPRRMFGQETVGTRVDGPSQRVVATTTAM